MIPQVTGLNLTQVFGVLNNPAFVVCGSLCPMFFIFGQDNTGSTDCKTHQERYTDKCKPKYLQKECSGGGMVFTASEVQYQAPISDAFFLGSRRNEFASQQRICYNSYFLVPKSGIPHP